MIFDFEVCNHFFNVVDMVVKTVNIFLFSLVFVLNQYFLMMLRDIFYHILVHLNSKFYTNLPR